MSHWYLRSKGKEEGPYSLAQLRRRMRSGDVDASDVVRSDGTNVGVPLYLCAELLQTSADSPWAARLGRKPMLWAAGVATLCVIIFAAARLSPNRSPVDERRLADRSGTPSTDTASPQASAQAPVKEEPRAAAPHVVKKVAADLPDASTRGTINDESAIPRTDFTPLPAPAKVLPPAAQESPVGVAPPSLPATESPTPVAEERAPALAVTAITAQAFAGDPLGSGELRIEFAAAERPTIHPDDALFLVGGERRVFYANFALEYADSATHLVSAITARFVFRGAEALRLSIAAAGEKVGESIDVAPQRDAEQRTALTAAWWKSQNDVIDEAPVDQRLIQYYLATGLARRLHLPQPAYPSTKASDHSAIEAQFEKAIGLLLGFDSVQLAMQADQDERLVNRGELADRSRPAAMQLRSVNVPAVSAKDARIEPIAMHVPAECFYVRCQSLANYLWLRELLVGWGGNIAQAVTLPTFEDQTRQRLEKQLVLDPRLALEAGLDRHLRDVALIGCDVLFADGAALGVVLEASDPAAAEAIIQAQRAVAQKQPDVNADAWTLNGRKLHRLATANHQIRSYLVIDGDFLLVTNSEYIARRFLQQGREKQSLGTLPEFRYARLKHPADADDAAFIYVSDPFFRNVVSPHYRIEMQRRAQAASDLRQLRVAYVAALAEGAPTDRIDDLVRGGFLPEDFGARPDGSYAAYRRGHVADSLRGAACTFLPVPDVPLDKVTPTEWESYRRFTEGYLRQWRLMDPVSVAIARGKRVDRREQIALDVCITPYAREHYAELSRSLARRRDREVAAHDDDLISINAAVNSEGAQRNVYGGLRDRPIDFEYSLGEVRPLGAQDGLGKSQFYLAMYPGNTNALKAVGSIFGERQPATTRTGAANLPTAWFRGGPVGLAAWGLQTVGSPFQMFKLMGLAERIEIRDLWLVMGSEKKFRDELFSTLELRRAASLPMVRFAMGDIARADAYPYVRAHTYLTARKASAQNAQFLNRLSGQLSARPDHMLRVATYLHDAQPICPLAGEYAKKAVAHGPAIWTGTNWSAPSLYNETSVPAAYEFAFLQWLRGMNVDFNLDNTTLRAQVQLEVEHP